ncbi:MAG: response regulator [Desulfovibrionaceae bacterium]
MNRARHRRLSWLRSRGWIDLQLYAMLSVALLSGLLLWWTNAAWRQSLVTSQEIFTNLRRARSDAIRAHLAVMRSLSGEPDIRLPEISTLFEQASERIARLGARLDPGREDALWNTDTPELRETLASYGKGLDRFRALAAQALMSGSGGLVRYGLELHTSFAGLEKQAEALGVTIQQRMAATIKRQERLGQLFFGLWLVFLVLLGLSLAAASAKRRRAETSRLESEIKYRSLFEQGMDATLLVANDSGEILDCNQAVPSEWGYAREELIGREPASLRAASPAAEDVAAQEIQYSNGRRAVLRETRIVTRSGEIREVAVKTGFFHLGERPVRLELYRDITERKKNERALAEKVAMLRVLGDNLPQGMIFELSVGVDGKRRFRHVSQGVEEIFGQSAGAILEHPELLLEPLAPEDRALLIRAETTARESLTVFDVAVRLDSARGDGRWVQFRAAPRPGEDGEILFDGVVFDITAQKRIEESLRQAKTEAEAASQAKTEFLANISHEVRTPLNGVLAMLQLLHASPLDAASSANVETALFAAHGLVRVLSDILDFSLLEAGRLVMHRDVLAIRGLATEIMRMLAVECQRKALRTELMVDAAVPAWIVTDGARLRQVLFNVIGNAVKFTERGLVSLDIAVASRQGQGVHLLFTVADTGIGIGAEQLDTIFEPFTQIDGSLTRKYGGTGLGLGIVKRLVGLLDGHILVESQQGCGTVFSFTIHAREVSAPRLVPVVPSTRPCDGHKRHVLVVEDEAVNRMATVAMLKKLGYTATAVEDGDQVLDALAGESFDVVLMDIQMPRVSGVEATRRIRKATEPGIDPRIPVIALTAHAMAGDREHYLASGMDAYLSKPVDMQALGETIVTVCDKRCRAG